MSELTGKLDVRSTYYLCVSMFGIILGCYTTWALLGVTLTDLLEYCILPVYFASMDDRPAIFREGLWSVWSLLLWMNDIFCIFIALVGLDIVCVQGAMSKFSWKAYYQCSIALLSLICIFTSQPAFTFLFGYDDNDASWMEKTCSFVIESLLEIVLISAHLPTIFLIRGYLSNARGLGVSALKLWPIVQLSLYTTLATIFTRFPLVVVMFHMMFGNQKHGELDRPEWFCDAAPWKYIERGLYILYHLRGIFHFLVTIGFLHRVHALRQGYRLPTHPSMDSQQISNAQHLDSSACVLLETNSGSYSDVSARHFQFKPLPGDLSFDVENYTSLFRRSYHSTSVGTETLLLRLSDESSPLLGP